MADGIEMKFPNLPDFQRQLEEFSDDLQLKVVRAGVAAAARVFRKIALTKVPVLRPRGGSEGPRNRIHRRYDARVAGNLRKSIYTARAKDSTRGYDHYVVSFKKKHQLQDPFYGRFLEDGWVPRGRGKALRGGERHKAFVRARDSGRKITKYAFLGPAYQAGKAAALAAFVDRVADRIKKENSKRIIK